MARTDKHRGIQSAPAGIPGRGRVDVNLGATTHAAYAPVLRTTISAPPLMETSISPPASNPAQLTMLASR
eukprot:11196919-Lingulodinium_polyedra.AAC.1